MHKNGHTGAVWWRWVETRGHTRGHISAPFIVIVGQWGAMFVKKQFWRLGRGVAEAGQ